MPPLQYPENQPIVIVKPIRNQCTPCLAPGKCNQDGVVYQATITSDGGRSENYVGLAKNFKKRWGKHKSTLKYKNRGEFNYVNILP